MQSIRKQFKVQSSKFKVVLDFLTLNFEHGTLNMSRKPTELRPVKIKRGYTRQSPGSVLYQAGNTMVLCTASVDPKVPDWLKGKGKGWITAEYNMLPHSTSPRKQRERGLKVDGRTTEIQRLIGRSL